MKSRCGISPPSVVLYMDPRVPAATAYLELLPPLPTQYRSGTGSVVMPLEVHVGEGSRPLKVT